MAALGWLLNLGFAAGTAAVVVVPDQPGIEYTLGENRLHHTIPQEGNQ